MNKREGPSWQTLLDEETRELLRRLEWRGATPFRVAASGAHVGPARGRSQEFAEHRSYVPGDDPRTLDWKVMARSDREIVRTYEEHSRLQVTLIVDSSGSMAFRGKRGPSKITYASQLAAALAHIFLRQGDSVSLLSYDRALRREVETSTRDSQLTRIMKALTRLDAGEGNGGLSQATAVSFPPGLIIPIGDFLGEGDEDALAHLGDPKKHSLVAFQVLTEEELSFPFDETVTLRDLETYELSEVDAARMRDGYIASLTAHLDALRSSVEGLGGELISAETRRPVAEVLVSYLGRKGGR